MSLLHQSYHSHRLKQTIHHEDLPHPRPPRCHGDHRYRHYCAAEGPMQGVLPAAAVQPEEEDAAAGQLPGDAAAVLPGSCPDRRCVPVPGHLAVRALHHRHAAAAATGAETTTAVGRYTARSHPAGDVQRSEHPTLLHPRRALVLVT
ncbi:hypothetical protein BRADI_2g39921v3 [Brachypodium distachyon]|uniref:Uncharacterized protein n=1 Tax=Brachypodium distachyon TaxID=15368 RepID=A0A2K2DCY8_BRADI|nr:hypothetical protein BRADI_2g39921v3 [Brachypodium distachyon]